MSDDELRTKGANKQKDHPEGGLSEALRDCYQAASIALLRRRYVIAPIPAKPRIIMAQVEGSGTAPAPPPPAKPVPKCTTR
jgi:hypothetical protein